MDRGEAMDEALEKRRGEIAYKLLKLRLKDDGLEISNHFRRRIGREAKMIGVPFVELLEFTTMLANEILVEVTDLNRAPDADELEGHGGGH